MKKACLFWIIIAVFSIKYSKQIILVLLFLKGFIILVLSYILVVPGLGIQPHYKAPGNLWVKIIKTQRLRLGEWGFPLDNSPKLWDSQIAVKKSMKLNLTENKNIFRKHGRSSDFLFFKRCYWKQCFHIVNYLCWQNLM